MSEIIASFMNLIARFIDDRATKLKKDQKIFEFDKKSFYFLRTSYACWSENFKAPIKRELIVREFIDEFNQEIIENGPYFNWWTKKRYQYYLTLARHHASLWSNNRMQFIPSYQNKILKEMEWLAKRIGEEGMYIRLMDQNKHD